MNLYVLDWESYYGAYFTLSKLTTESYIRDPRFEEILLGIKCNDEPAYWVDAPDIHDELLRLNLPEHAVLAHHAQFDGLILDHHHGIRPKIWFDTLSMARAVRGGVKLGNSLAKLAEYYNLGVKGKEVILAKEKRRKDFSPAEIAQYGQYCMNDCDLEHSLFGVLLPHFCAEELKLIDTTVRMFTEPVLRMDRALLIEYGDSIRAKKQELLASAGIELAQVMSNDKFADALRNLGVDPPTKISARTGKVAYAFAKTDEGLQELADHEDVAVQTLVAARLQNKTTIAETRAHRMVWMVSRGAACVYYHYYGAGVTGRMSGGDKMNWQNFNRGGALRDAIMAPPGSVLVVGDSSNIEARILDWLSQQENMLEHYRAYDASVGPDIYCVMAESLYGYAVTKKDHPAQRQMGKVIKLMSGYGAGGAKMTLSVRQLTKKVISVETGTSAVNVYRQKHPYVVQLWKRAESALFRVLKGEYGVAVDPMGVILTCPEGLVLPNGLVIKYPDLKYHGPKKFTDDSEITGWTYWNGKNRVNLYGGKVVENICQALARIVVLYQCMNVKPWKLVMTSHDEGVWCVPEQEAEEAQVEVQAALRTPLSWCSDLPLNCEVGYAQRYGQAKK